VLLRLLASLDAPSSGSLTWRGQAVTRRNILAYRRAVAYVAQRPAMFDGSVEDNLRIPYTLAIYRDSRYDPAAVETLLKAAGRDARFLAKSADELSGGEAQITALIRVLQLRPAVLLLDEPTAALDPDSAATVEAMVDSWFQASPAAALAWISHNPSQAQRIGNRTLHMEAGRVQEVRPA
jgi:putative ABC transport system ATP-binding protein